MGLMRLHLKKFDEFLTFLMAKKDITVTRKEMERIFIYRNKISLEEKFTVEEFKDFSYLMRKIRKELPKNKKSDFDWISSGLLNFALAPIIDELI